MDSYALPSYLTYFYIKIAYRLHLGISTIMSPSPQPGGRRKSGSKLKTNASTSTSNVGGVVVLFQVVVIVCCSCSCRDDVPEARVMTPGRVWCASSCCSKIIVLERRSGLARSTILTWRFDAENHRLMSSLSWSDAPEWPTLITSVGHRLGSLHSGNGPPDESPSPLLLFGWPVSRNVADPINCQLSSRPIHTIRVVILAWSAPWSCS